MIKNDFDEIDHNYLFIFTLFYFPSLINYFFFAIFKLVSIIHMIYWNYKNSLKLVKNSLSLEKQIPLGYNQWVFCSVPMPQIPSQACIHNYHPIIVIHKL